MVDKSTLDACLKDISFPADGHTIVECAEGNSCPRDVLSQVQAMPPLHLRLRGRPPLQARQHRVLPRMS